GAALGCGQTGDLTPGRGALVVSGDYWRSTRRTSTPAAACSACSAARATRRAPRRSPHAVEAVDRWLDCRQRLRLTGRHPPLRTLKGEPLWDSYVRTLCKRLAAKAGVRSACTRTGSGTGGL